MQPFGWKFYLVVPVEWSADWGMIWTDVWTDLPVSHSPEKHPGIGENFHNRSPESREKEYKTLVYIFHWQSIKKIIMKTGYKMIINISLLLPVHTLISYFQLMRYRTQTWVCGCYDDDEDDNNNDIDTHTGY